MKLILNKTTLILIFLMAIFITIPFYLELQNKKSKQLQKSNSEVPIIDFWQYWSGSEKEPLQKLVNKFNSEDHGFKVNMLSISMPRKKILMSIVGKVPPDLVHLDGDMVTDFATRGALTNLNLLLNIEEDFPRAQSENFLKNLIPVYAEMLNIQGKQWALPLMPTCEAMHINKELLSKHNLDKPEKLDDLINIFNSATDFQSFKEIGWLPTWPPWVGKFIPVVFGGKWAETNNRGEVTITANSPENIQAWTWVQENFASKIPKDKLAAFTEGFQAYQSPDNPFYSGRIATENNGVWEKHLASKFAPSLDVEIAPFPSDNYPMATLVTVDAMAIPRGAKHPKLAFQFMLWLLKQENIEKLALAQHKFSPLKNMSSDFVAKHPNPYVQTFIDLANSPNAVYFPQVSFVEKYQREILKAYDKVVRMETSAKEALDELQKNIVQLN